MGRFRLAVTAGGIGILIGATALAAFAWRFPNLVSVGRRTPVSTTPGPSAAFRGDSPAAAIRRAPPSEPRPVRRPAPIPAPEGPSDATVEPAFEADPVAELRRRVLEVPVQGVRRDKLVDSYEDKRDQTHTHHAIDILAPRNTPVVAVEDGTIAKLFLSVPGGITIYQFDPGKRYEYYYAHLERYADGLHEGQRVAAGDVIGYVGTSGNAPPGTPHLHFAIFEVGPEKRWWKGEALDPYLVFKK